MNKKHKIITIALVLLITAIVSYKIYTNYKELKTAQTICGNERNSSDCYNYTYRKLIPHFLMYKAQADKKPLRFLRLGISWTSNYIVPYIALKKAEAVIGYGILDDITFEDKFSELYNKPSYGFDCGVRSVPVKHPKCVFESECIGTDKFVLDDLVSSQKVHLFTEKIKELGLENKPVYIRMDIAGAEPYVMDDILKNSKNITGMVIVVHCDSTDQIDKVEKMLKNIEKDFILVVRQTHYANKLLYQLHIDVPYTKNLSTKMVLSYVNKNLVDDYNIKYNQDTKDMPWDGEQFFTYNSDIQTHRYAGYIIKKELEAKKELLWRLIKGQNNE